MKPGVIAVMLATGCAGVVSDLPQRVPESEDGGQVGTPSLDAGASVDAGIDAGLDGGMADGGTTSADAGLVELVECTTPSIDRLTYWSAPEGVLETASGVRWTLLVEEQATQVARVHFLGNDWHGALVMLTNATVMDSRADSIVDATHARELIITYSATSDFWVQLRSYDSFGGPNLFAAAIPATGGQRATIRLSFDRSMTTWASLFQEPALGWSETLAQLKAIAIVDNSENDLAFYGLRIDGYVPRCP